MSTKERESRNNKKKLVRFSDSPLALGLSLLRLFILRTPSSDKIGCGNLSGLASLVDDRIPGIKVKTEITQEGTVPHYSDIAGVFSKLLAKYRSNPCALALIMDMMSVEEFREVIELSDPSEKQTNP